MNEQRDETLVTGSPVSSDGGPRIGQVLGERYEVAEKLGSDPFTLDYRATDQETESDVLLRVVDPKHLPLDEAKNVARRLSRVIGIGGEYLSPLLDADCDGVFLFVVEPMVRGTTLREVLRARAARYDILSPKEMLPVTARLGAALAAIPPPFRHGDVRADRVHIDREELKLTCPFLLAALPTSVVSEILKADPRIGRLFAPEVITDGAGDASDRFSVAALVFEALTGRVPERGAPSATELGNIGDVLQAMLAPDPDARPATLEPLIEVLAERAELPVPELEPGAFKQPRRLSVRRKSEQALPAVTTDDDLSADDTEPRTAGAEPATSRNATVEMRRRPARDTIEMKGSPLFDAPVVPPADDTRRVVTVDTPEAPAKVAPRTVPDAAPGGTQEIDASEIFEEQELDAKTDPSDAGLDPRLVRAALGVELAGSPDDTPTPTPASQPMPRAPRPANPTLELNADDLEMVEQAVQKLPSLREAAAGRPRKAPVRTKPVMQPEEVPIPAGIKPIPKPRLDSVPPPASAPAPSPLFDEASVAQPFAASAPTPPQASYVPQEPMVPPRARGRRGFDTWVIEPGQEPEPYSAARRSGSASKWIVLIAALLGLLIIGVGWLIADQRRDNIERERRLQERFEQLRETEQ